METNNSHHRRISSIRGIPFIVLAVLFVGGVAELWDLTRRTEVAALFGTWLIGKDWRDLFPSKRNTASWGLLPHREVTAARSALIESPGMLAPRLNQVASASRFPLHSAAL